MGYVISYDMYTDAGSRAVNEDSLLAFSKGDENGFILCDGLGGMGMGDQASQIVVQVFRDVFLKSEKIKKYLPVAFQAAQDVLTGEQIRLNARERMKTTAVSVVMDKKNAYIGHIGDSRLYIFRDKKVLKRTLDHSIPQMLALTGEISETEIRHHKNRSILLRTMGVEWEEPMYDIMKPISLSKCDAMLLCSDGFWELLEDAEMCEALAKSRNPKEWLERMANTVRQHGQGKDMDNNSAIAIWITKG